MASQRVSKPTERQQRPAVPRSGWQPQVQKQALLQLQQTVGNQAFQQLLRAGVLQARLAGNQPGDMREQVAEQVAQLTPQAMRMLRRQPVEQQDNAPLGVTTETPPPMPAVAPAVPGGNDTVRRGGQPTRAADSEKAPVPLVKQETEALPAVAGAVEDSAAAAAVGEETLESPAPPEKALASPEEDAAYQAVVEQVGIKAQHQKIPPKKPEQKQAETTLAANLPPEKITKQNAYDTHLNQMEQVQARERIHELTVEKFIDEFKATSDKLAEKLPENKEKRGTVHAIVEFSAGTATAKQAVANQNKAYADPLRTEVQKAASEYEKKAQEAKPYELQVDPAGRTPTIKHAATAAPKPKMEEEISLDDHSRALDDALVNHNVSGQTINIDEGSLAFPVSGEKTFDEAGEAKRKAQDEIEKAKPRYREKEMGEISKAQGEMQSFVRTGLQGYHSSRSKSFGKVLKSQQKHEGNIEREKGDFFSKFQKIYEGTKKQVNDDLIPLNGIEEIFEGIVSRAEERFQSLVRNDLEYIYTPGFFDYSDWKDKHESEIKVEFEKLLSQGEVRYQERMFVYMKAMRIVQDRSAAELFRYAKWEFTYNVMKEVREKIANKVVEALNAAKKHIKDGEDRAKEAYDLLPPKEQEEAAQVFEAVKGQFQTLKESVEDRQREIINDMARTYNKSVGKLQATFDAIKKDVLTSWFEKAWNKLKAIVNAIIEFATRLAQLLGRMISLLGDIISSPRYFFNNLVTGIARGFSTFAERIDEFLATAFFDWLRGASGMPVQLPKDWGPQGIFSLFTQLLNLSKETIWQRMEIVYDKTTANAFRRGEVLLEKGLEIFRIIKNEGLGGLWEHIKESLGTILNDTLEMIKETVLYAAIKKVIIEIGKMLVPGGGFIAIAEKVIRLLQFIVEARNKILDLIESFVDSMANAVKGDIPGIVNHITGALTKFITIALDFLVTFFGLGGLKAKVERFIERMRKPIIRGIDWVLGKLKPFVMKAMQKGQEFVEKGQEFVEKGKEKVVEAGIALLNWLGLRREFKTADGAEHSIFFKGNTQNAVLMVASINPTPVEIFLKSKKEIDKSASSAYDYFINFVKKKEDDVQEKEKTFRDISGDKKEEKRAARYAHQVAVQQLRNYMKDFADKLALVSFDSDNAHLQARTVVRPSLHGGRAGNVTAWPLTYLPGNEVGSAPFEDPPGWKGYAQDSSEQWVRGHLLSEHLHGPGRKWNLVPVIQATNSGMRTVEAKVMPLIKQQGKLYYYSATAHYEDRGTTPDEKAIPSSISITWGELSKVGQPGDASAKKSTIDEGPFTQDLPNFGGPPNLNTAGAEIMFRKGIRLRLARDIRTCATKFVETQGGFTDLNDLFDKMERFYQNTLTKLPNVDDPKKNQSSFTDDDKKILIEVIEIKKEMVFK
jgi:hypothetical protein